MTKSKHDEVMLKPCPFCGGKASMLRRGPLPPQANYYGVACLNDNCTVKPHTVKYYPYTWHAASAWNARFGDAT